MPPVLVAFFIMIGAATVPPLVGGLTTGKDKITRPKWGEPAEQRYTTWTSRPWIAVADKGARQCDVTFFALATRNRVTRLVAGGVEQELNSSWSFPRVLRAGERRTVAFEFLDPVGGARLACHEETLSCYAQTFGEPDTEVREGRCRPDAAAPKRKGGNKVFSGHTRPFAMYDNIVGGAYVDVSFEITGEVDEGWYCPAIEVLWPDGTMAKRESDCPPFETRDPEVRFKWTFTHGFSNGTWPVKACISKSSRQLACTSVIVRVIGGGE